MPLGLSLSDGLTFIFIALPCEFPLHLSLSFRLFFHDFRDGIKAILLEKGTDISLPLFSDVHIVVVPSWFWLGGGLILFDGL